MATANPTPASFSANTELPKIIFYDLDHTLTPKTRSWSPATARTALALHHRKFPHTRQAVSYPDIAPLLSSHGVPEAQTQSKIKYTLPAISLHHADGTEQWVMDSVAIAPLLESLAPVSEEHPSLFPEGERTEKLVKQVREAASKAVDGVWEQIVAWVPLFLDEKAVPYFNETRLEQCGDTMENLRKVQPKRPLVDEFKTALEYFAKIYVENKPGDGKKEDEGEESGPFLGGRQQPSYPDMVVVAAIEWWRCARGDEVVDPGLKEVEGGVLWPVVERLAGVLRREQ